MDIQLKLIDGDNQLRTIESMAISIWNECYCKIISKAQIDYMLDQFQSYEALKQQMNEGYYYYFITYEEQIVGYAGLKPEQDQLFLSKIYLVQEHRGKGYGMATIDLLVKVAQQHGCSSMWLTVNRNNETAIKTYMRKGFTKVKDQVADIGNGYVMDDYVMELMV